MSAESLCLHCGKRTRSGEYLCRDCHRMYQRSHRDHGVQTVGPGVHKMELTK